MPETRAVLLPGSGSDEVFVRSVFAGPLGAFGMRTEAPAPPRGAAVIMALLTALDEAAADGPVLTGGISLGAHLAAEWALRNPDRCAGLLLAMPAWCGRPGDAPASLAARASADLVTEHGLDEALRLATAEVAPWLGGELTRAWRRQGDGLAAGLRAASAHPAPTLDELAGIGVPVGIAACTDDPVHPVAVAHAWADAIPRAAVQETTLTALGADRETLGRAALLAWLRARA